jgi:hypothetical protein
MVSIIMSYPIEKHCTRKDSFLGTMSYSIETANSFFCIMSAFQALPMQKQLSGFYDTRTYS